MYPIGYDGDDVTTGGNEYQLGPYGKIGTGTLYPATWHYFRISRFKDGVPELWTQRVKTILSGQKIIPRFPSCFYRNTID
jgi:hypothetical protein